MASKYKEKLIKEIEETPQEIIPKLYEVIHHLRDELMQKARMPGKRGSLKGIYKGSVVDEKFFRMQKAPSSHTKGNKILYGLRNRHPFHGLVFHR